MYTVTPAKIARVLHHSRFRDYFTFFIIQGGKTKVWTTSKTANDTIRIYAHGLILNFNITCRCLILLHESESPALKSSEYLISAFTSLSVYFPGCTQFIFSRHLIIQEMPPLVQYSLHAGMLHVAKTLTIAIFTINSEQEQPK